ncbi:MAG: DUF7680 family protein [Longimicrobiales bacterium]
MKRQTTTVRSIETPASAPQYELRVRYRAALDPEYEVWQVPARATPWLRSPLRLAGLHGRNLELVEHRVHRHLSRAGIRLQRMRAGEEKRYVLSEQLALTLGLLFRVLAPMRSRDNMRKVTEGVEAMPQEEAAYWLGMAMHRPNPRRVLTALRVLLTDPRRRPELVS